MKPKIYVITGATSGIGKALVKILSKDSIVFAGRNGLYYEGLGKDKLERSDLEPGYTFQEYMEIIERGGLGDDDSLGRQRAVLRNPNIQFDSKEAMPYVSSKVEESSTGNAIKK